MQPAPRPTSTRFARACCDDARARAAHRAPPLVTRTSGRAASCCRESFLRGGGRLSGRPYCIIIRSIESKLFVQLDSIAISQ
jgi:hypothetical protein